MNLHIRLSPGLVLATLLAGFVLALFGGDRAIAAQQVPEDLISGVGWIQRDTGAKAGFGVAGGVKLEDFWGHLVYIDRGSDLRVKAGDATGYLHVDDTTREICGRAQTNHYGEVDYRVRVSDQGRPGDNDIFVLQLSKGGDVLYTTANDADNTLGGSGRGGGDIKLHDGNRATTAPSTAPVCEGEVVNGPDTTPPTVTITSPAEGATVSGNVTVAADASDDTTVAGVRFFVDGTAIGTEDTTAPYEVSWDTSAVADGSHTLTAEAGDAAGNTTTSSPVSVTVDNADTTSPTVAITSPADGATVSGSVAIAADASDDTGVAGVRFLVDGALIADDTSAPYEAGWDSTTVADGTHTLTAEARDAGGNTTTSSISVTVDNADTAPPTVAITSPADGATVSGSVAIAADASDDTGVAGVRFLVDGALITDDTSAPYEAGWDSTTVADGTHTLTAEARDAAGNVTTSSPVSVTVDNTADDTTPPSVTVTSPADGSTVSGTVTVSADASDASGIEVVEFVLDGTRLGSLDSTAPYELAWDTTTAADGAHTLQARARDNAGNIGESTVITVTVDNGGGGGGDTTPPTVTVTSPADGSTVSGTVTVSADASDASGIEVVEFVLDGTRLGSLDTTAPYEVAWDTTTAADGAHTLQARARDNAGNIGESTMITVTVDNAGGGGGDTTPPSVAMTSPADGATVSGGVTIAADAADDTGVAGVRFLVDGALVADDTASPYEVSWDSTTVADGAHTLAAEARDAAGNTSSASITVTVDNGGGGGGTTTRIEETHPSIGYVGNWINPNDSSLSGGSATESQEAGATATVTFDGTGIAWIGIRCGCTAGIAEVFVDGTFVAEVDGDGPPPESMETQVVLFSVSGLAPGTHTLRIEVTGRAARSDASAWVLIDAFDITQ